MNRHSIQINVTLDNENMPDHIDWTASGSNTPDTPQHAKGMLLSLWDGQEKTAMRIDLWTKRMMVDEMNDFFFQTMMTLSDTYSRATKNEDLSKEMKDFALSFKKKAEEKLLGDEQK
jgi:gliding motility-associated protein GldC